jgi:hypothetical protein
MCASLLQFAALASVVRSSVIAAPRWGKLIAVGAMLLVAYAERTDS